MTRLCLALALLTVGLAASGQMDDGASPDARTAFRRGRIELTAGGGYGEFDSRDYLLLALGGAYYLRDGLSVGATGEAWTGSRPQIYDASPDVRYVFLDSTWRFKPYAGLFYRRTGFSRGLEPLNSTGGRSGVIIPVSSRAYVAAGLAYEHYFDCNTSVYPSCDDVYPEFQLTFGF